jgi:hypothetical protein
MQVPAQCPECRQVDERRQAMYEVGSAPRSRGPDAVVVVDLKEMDTADVHSGKLTLRCEHPLCQPGLRHLLPDN